MRYVSIQQTAISNMQDFIYHVYRLYTSILDSFGHMVSPLCDELQDFQFIAPSKTGKELKL